jgi:hypothetical protein
MKHTKDSLEVVLLQLRELQQAGLRLQQAVLGAWRTREVDDESTRLIREHFDALYDAFRGLADSLEK